MTALVQPAPRLGEHNEEILCDLLGYSPEQVKELGETGVL
jgi:crotonobetainyl-CoA:carnitine CoA-transferase CaiB-like acyl-CoA transferase